MPRKSSDSDPFQARRRLLAEQERQLSDQRRKLNLSINGDKPAAAKPEPPLWRLEDEGRPSRITDPTPSRRRHLAQQRRRDRMIVLALVAVLLLVVGIVVWVAYVHNLSTGNGT